MRVFFGYLCAVTAVVLCWPVALIISSALGGHVSYMPGNYAQSWADIVHFIRVLVFIWAAIFVLSAAPFIALAVTAKVFRFYNILYCLFSAALIIQGLGAFAFFVLGSAMGEGMARPTFVESFAFWPYLLPVGLVSGLVFWMISGKAATTSRPLTRPAASRTAGLP